jgi:glycosyltransferase involved in cell wall biosynthesis
MAQKPFLSVVMPIHDGAEWIGATLDTVAAEPLAGVEFIVIDSSPTDATAAIVESYEARVPLRLLRRPDVAAWQSKTNIGVDLASAEHVCILHQDDLWLPGRTEAVRGWIERAAEAALHLAPSFYVDRRGERMGRWHCPLPAEVALDRELLLERLLVQNFVSVPAPVIRRSAWLDCGGMDDALWYTADWDIWLKLASAGPVVYHEDFTTAFRIHGSSLTMTGSRDARDFRSQMETVLDRYTGELPVSRRRGIERVARASIDVNVLLAAASGGNVRALASATGNVLSLGPAGMSRYLRDSRLHERTVSRLRARLAGAF